MKLTTVLTVLVAALAVVLAGGTSAMGGDFSVGYSDGSSWNSIYAQGFSPSVSPDPNPGLLPGHQVALNEFSFFASGNTTTEMNVKLAIISPFFSNIFNMQTTSPYVVGLSDNTIADPDSINTGDPITYTFSGLPLTYGNGYAAVFVTQSGTSLTPVLIPALVADYVETAPGSGIFVPETNYGTDTQFDYAVSNFFTTTNLPPPPTRFFNTFDYAADANFLASFSVIPEPATLALGLVSLGLASVSRRRRIA